MRDSIYRCDECKAQKGEGNRWLLAVAHNTHGLEFRLWDDDLAKEDNVSHLCGEQCAQRRLNEFFADRSRM